MLDHNGKYSPHIDEEYEAVYLLDSNAEYDLYETDSGELVVEEHRTGMKLYARNYDEARQIMNDAWNNSNTGAPPTKTRVLGHDSLSDEEKAAKQREILDKFANRVVDFMIRATPHEKELADRAHRVLMRCTRDLENEGPLSKERLEKLETLYSRMSR